MAELHRAFMLAESLTLVSHIAVHVDTTCIANVDVQTSRFLTPSFTLKAKFSSRPMISSMRLVLRVVEAS